MEIVPESCRLCLSSDGPTFPIYERLSLIEITELLQDILGIQINYSEEHINICNGCEVKAKLMYSIVFEFRQSDKLFCFFLEQKRAIEGIPLIEEAKHTISIVATDVNISPSSTEHGNVEHGTEHNIKEAIHFYAGDEGDEDPEYAEDFLEVRDYSSDDDKLGEPKLLLCFICKGFNGNEETLHIHLKEQHGSVAPYYCHKCLVRLEDVVSINYHYRSHEFPFGCLYCEEAFTTEAELLTHQEYCIGYYCSHCTNQFHFLHSFKEHECKASKSARMRNVNAMIGSRRDQSRFIPQVCAICSEDLGNNNRLAQHFEREHEDFPVHLYKCDICPQKFTELLAVRFHRLSHKKDSTVKQRKISAVERNDCTICSQVFKFNKELLAHIEAEHADSGLEFHQCLNCIEKFTSEAELLKHDYNTHQGKQPQYSCSFCGRVFSERLGLRGHENIHRGIKEYHCKDCNKDFTYKSTYKRHMKVVHTDTKQFTCEYCHKSFKRKPTLKVHLRLHTGEKPYQCEYCSRRFVDPSSFHRHKQKEHGWKSINY
ncbi:zinc finger and SCAN domain-containing protein 2-like [Toxorhynchites rutilus septentrionalis]|uniref:zinc finger and SCAN domain-containing protein 2-like n=1 Tax=Toxorhynchites rutilus septentrionalis TaxID=329112 RepID=UPI0024796175|nr:zinc finger and SCAN domain-containing protein 2-like [Toxorhynchites rutilus septentrionalis]XP_055638471.1 zinc finger and SCAN domain-containing protein 2-like [Toxorhynchites rutilus septentrionalis]